MKSLKVRRIALLNYAKVYNLDISSDPLVLADKLLSDVDLELVSEGPDYFTLARYYDNGNYCYTAVDFINVRSKKYDKKIYSGTREPTLEIVYNLTSDLVKIMELVK